MGLCYTFEAIYHFFYPVPGIIDAVEQEKALSAEAEAEGSDSNEEQPIVNNQIEEQEASFNEESEENNDEQKN